jgi:hypothetical protein
MNVRQVLMEMLTGGGPEQFDGAAEQGQPQQPEAAPQTDMGQPVMPDMAPPQGMQ